MVYGYARVSSLNQARNNTQEAQIKALKEAGAEEIFFDAFTGTSKNRPELNSLLSVIQEGDTLIITRLDRISRSLSQGVELIEELLNRGVIVNVLNIGLMDDSATGTLIRNVFLSFAQYDKDMILQRLKEGREMAKQKPGWREGRPKKPISITQVKELLKRQQNGEITVSECCESLNISKSKWYLLLREMNFIE